MKITNYKGEYKELPWDNASTEYCEVPYIENFHKPDLCRYDIPIINEVLGVDMGGFYGTLRLSGNWRWRRKVGVVICDDKEEDAYADATPEKILKHYNSAFPKHDKIENETIVVTYICKRCWKVLYVDMAVEKDRNMEKRMIKLYGKTYVLTICNECQKKHLERGHYAECGMDYDYS